MIFPSGSWSTKSPGVRTPNSTLILVIEDDPQDGADQISQGGAEGSGSYSTATMMRAIEDIPGVSHLSVHDSGVPQMAHALDITENCHAVNGGGSTCWTLARDSAKRPVVCAPAREDELL